MFKQAGQFKGQVLETMIAEPKFSKDPNAFDVCIKVEGPDGQSDWWRGEMSPEYGKGTVSHLTQAQITIQNLRKVGFQGNDLTQLDAQLKGKEIDYTVEPREYNGKNYYDVKYIGAGDFAPKALDPNSLAQKMAGLGLTAGAPAQTTPPPQQTAQTTPPPQQAAPDATVPSPWG